LTMAISILGDRGLAGDFADASEKKRDVLSVLRTPPAIKQQHAQTENGPINDVF
jgi:hypothetical protein